VAVSSSRPSTANAESFVDDVTDFDQQSMEHVSSLQPEHDEDLEQPTHPIQEAASSPLTISSPRDVSDAESGVLPGSYPKSEGGTPPTEYPIPEEEEEDSEADSDHVNDRIANQFAELEKDQAMAVQVGLGLGDITTNGMSSVVVHNIVRGAPVYQHTELTPIMEHSDRESLNAGQDDYAEPPIVPSKASPPPTRHSNRSGKSPSQTDSIHSAGGRTASLTSQAERLRNMFLRRNSPERELMVDAEDGAPDMEKRMRFESLIRSGETMRMTLTPTSLRSIEVSPQLLLKY
jgi:hypothetical protein